MKLFTRTKEHDIVNKAEIKLRWEDKVEQECNFQFIMGSGEINKK